MDRDSESRSKVDRHDFNLQSILSTLQPVPIQSRGVQLQRDGVVRKLDMALEANEHGSTAAPAATRQATTDLQVVTANGPPVLQRASSSQLTVSQVLQSLPSNQGSNSTAQGDCDTSSIVPPARPVRSSRRYQSTPRQASPGRQQPSPAINLQGIHTAAHMPAPRHTRYMAGVPVSHQVTDVKASLAGPSWSAASHWSTAASTTLSDADHMPGTAGHTHLTLRRHTHNTPSHPTFSEQLADGSAPPPKGAAPVPAQPAEQLSSALTTEQLSAAARAADGVGSWKPGMLLPPFRLSSRMPRASTAPISHPGKSSTAQPAVHEPAARQVAVAPEPPHQAAAAPAAPSTLSTWRSSQAECTELAGPHPLRQGSSPLSSSHSMPDLRSIPVSNARHAGSGVMSLLLAEQLGQDPLRLPSPAPASSGPNADPVEQSAASRRATQNILWQEWQQQQGQQQGSGQEQQVQSVVQQPGRQRSASATWLQAEGVSSTAQPFHQQQWLGLEEHALPAPRPTEDPAKGAPAVQLSPAVPRQLSFTWSSTVMGSGAFTSAAPSLGPRHQQPGALPTTQLPNNSSQAPGLTSSHAGSRSSQQEWEGAGSQPGRRDGGGEQAGPEGQQQAGQHIQATGPSQQLRPWGLEPHQAGVEGSQGGSLLAASFDSFIVTQPSMQHQQQRQAEQQSVGRQQQGQWQMDQQHSGWASQAGAKQPVPTKHQPPQQHPPHLQQQPTALQQQRPKAETSWPEGYPQQDQIQPLAQPGQHRSATATPSSPHQQAARGLLPEPHHTMVHQAWGPAALPAAVRTQQAAPLHGPQGVAVAAAPTAAWQMQEQPEGPLGRLQSMTPDLEITLARAPAAGVSALAAREGEGERRAGLGGRGAGGQGGEVTSAAAHHGSQEAGGGRDDGGGASSGEDCLAESGDESGDEAEAGRQALLSFLLLKASRARQRRQLRAVLHGWQRAAQAARLDGLLLQTVVRLRAEHVMRGVLKHWQCLVASPTAPEAPSTTLPTASSQHPGQHFLHTRATPAQPTVTITSTIGTGSSKTGDGSSSNGRSSSSSSKRGRSKSGSGVTGVPDAAATDHPSQSQSWSAGSSTSPPPPQPILLAGHSAANSASSLAVTSQPESQVSSSSRVLASRPGHEPRPVAWDPAEAEYWQHETAGGPKHRGGPRGRCSEEQDQGEQQGEEEEEEDMGQALSGPSCAAQPGRLPLRSAVPAAEPCASPTRHQRQPLHSFPGSDSHAAARASHADAVLLASPAPQASAPPSDLQELHSLVSRMEALLWQQSRQEQGSRGPGQQRAGFMQRKEVQGWQDQGRPGGQGCLPEPPTSSAAAMQARIARLMRLSPALQPQLEQLMDDAPDTAALSQPHQWQQQQQLPQGGATTGTQAKASALPKQGHHPANAPPTAQPHNVAPRRAPGQQQAKIQRHLRLVRPSRPGDPPASMTHGGSGRASPPPPSPPSPPLPQGSKVGGGREPPAAGRQAHQAHGANALQPAVHTAAGYGAAQAWETGDMHQHLCPDDISQRLSDDGGGGGEYSAGRLAAYGDGLGDEAAASRSETLLPGRLQRLANMQALRRQQHKPGKALAAATVPGEQVLDPVWSTAEQDQQLHAEAAKPAQTHGYAEALRLRLRALKSSPARKQAAAAQPATSVATAGAASTAALQQLADMRQHVRQLEAQVREAMVDLTPGHSGPAAAAVNVRPPIRTPGQAQALALEGVPSSSRRNHLAKTNHGSRHADLLASEYPRTQQDSAARVLLGNEPDRRSGPLDAARPDRAVSAPRTRLGVKPAGAATAGSSKLGPAGDVHVGIRSDTHSWRVKDQEKQMRGAGGEAGSAAIARQQAVPTTGQSTASRLHRAEGTEGKAAQAAMVAWAAGASITGTASAAPWISKVPVQTKMDKGSGLTRR